MNVTIILRSITAFIGSPEYSAKQRGTFSKSVSESGLLLSISLFWGRHSRKCRGDGEEKEIHFKFHHPYF